MPFNKENLELELGGLLGHISAQINAIYERADFRGDDPTLLKYPDGTYILAPLLAAKAQTIHSIVLLKNME